MAESKLTERQNKIFKLLMEDYLSRKGWDWNEAIPSEEELCMVSGEIDELNSELAEQAKTIKPDSVDMPAVKHGA